MGSRLHYRKLPCYLWNCSKITERCCVESQIVRCHTSSCSSKMSSICRQSLPRIPCCPATPASLECRVACSNYIKFLSIFCRCKDVYLAKNQRFICQNLVANQSRALILMRVTCVLSLFGVIFVPGGGANLGELLWKLDGFG